MSIETRPEKISGLDTTIKVLVIIKLLVQLAFYGLVLGMTLWFLIENPVPELMERVQNDVFRSFQGG